MHKQKSEHDLKALKHIALLPLSLTLPPHALSSFLVDLQARIVLDECVRKPTWID